MSRTSKRWFGVLFEAWDRRILTVVWIAPELLYITEPQMSAGGTITVEQDKRNPRQFRIMMSDHDLPNYDVWPSYYSVEDLDNLIDMAVGYKLDCAEERIKAAEVGKWIFSQPKGTFTRRDSKHIPPDRKAKVITEHRFGYRVIFKDKAYAALFKQMFCATEGLKVIE